MNIRTVLRTYGLLRQLTDDETALLETLRSLTDGDREQLVESLAPAKPAVRKRKSRAKSQRASSMAETLDKNLSAQREAALKDVTGESDDDAPLHQQHCGTCSNAFGHEDHAQPSPHYHEFGAAGAKAGVAAGD